MSNDEHVAILRRGAAAWNAWRQEQNVTADLSGAGLRRLDLSAFDLSQADLRDADLRGTTLSHADLSGAHLERTNLFKAVLDGADLAGAFLYEAKFLNCAQLVVTIAVGTPITGRPPHRTVRAAFLHTAPTSDD